MIPVSLVYAGLLLVFLGFVSLLKPLKFLRIRTRRRGALILLLGLVVVAAGMALPSPEIRIAEPRTQLDHFVPVYQFAEFHSIRVAAPRDQVYRAIKGVTADEIFLFRTLIWIRRFGRKGPESILNPSERLPLLEVATRTTFLYLADNPGDEIVVGTAVVAPPGWRPRHHPTPEGFRNLHAPGFALAAMNFRLEDAGPGACRVTTETRVYATDAGARRRFARYWRVIYPGSALIRRMWLRAIRQRAEGGRGATGRARATSPPALIGANFGSVAPETKGPQGQQGQKGHQSS
jgi:hypothetical protein